MFYGIAKSLRSVAIFIGFGSQLLVYLSLFWAIKTHSDNIRSGRVESLNLCGRRKQIFLKKKSIFRHNVGPLVTNSDSVLS